MSKKKTTVKSSETTDIAKESLSPELKKTELTEPKSNEASWFTISTIEQLNAVANPKRQRLLAEFVDQAKTTKQVAEILGEPPTRLYHHVDALVKHGILVLDREVQKRGTIEKYYKAAARRIRVDESCLTNESCLNKNSQFLADMLDNARAQLLQSLEKMAASTDHPFTTAANTLIWATDSEIKAIADTLVDNLEKVSSPSLAKKPGAKPYRMMVLIFPEDEG